MVEERKGCMEKLTLGTFTVIAGLSLVNAVAVRIFGERVNCIKPVEEINKHRLCIEDKGFWMSGAGGSWRYTQGEFRGTRAMGDTVIVGYRIDGSNHFMVIHQGKFIAEAGDDSYLQVNFDEIGDFINTQ